MGKSKPALPVFTVKYKQLNSRAAANLITRMHQALIEDNAQACRIHKFVSVVKPAIIQMEDEYTEEVQKPHRRRMLEIGFDVENPPEDKDITPEMNKKLKELDEILTQEQNKFGEKTVDLEVLPLSPQDFKGIKHSASELDSLGELFDETGKIRQKYIENKLAVVE